MQSGDRGLFQSSVLAVVLVAFVGVAAAAGLAVTTDGPSGDEVLDAAEQRYESADSVVVDATVTVENASETTTFDLSVAAAGDEQRRANVSGAEGHVVVGTDGETTWVRDSRSELTRVLAENGTANWTRPDADFATAGEDDPANASLAALAEAHNATLPEHVDGDVTLADWNGTRENATAERVETTTLDGQEVHVVSVTHPDTASELRVWVAAESDEVLKQRFTDPESDVTVTVDVTTTRFDVSPADSTFQPPGETATPAEVASVAELREAAPFAVAVPGGNWTFERGGVTHVPETVAAAQYSDGAETVSVLQTARDPPAVDDGETVTAGNRSVTFDTRGNRTVAWWTEANVTTAVSGDVADEDLRAVVADVEFED